MKQRYDLFAFSLLMFSVVFAAWLVALPVGADRLSLMGGLVAAIGIVIAAWNVTRQMRLTARSREQDRIEKELPGLRAASDLAVRFLTKARSHPDVDNILEEFGFFSARTPNGADFDAFIDSALPLTSFTTRRELSRALQALRDSAEKLDSAERSYRTTNQNYRYTSEPMIAGHKARVAAAISEKDMARQKLDSCIEELSSICDQLSNQIADEDRKRAILRTEQNRLLGIER